MVSWSRRRIPLLRCRIPIISFPRVSWSLWLLGSSALLCLPTSSNSQPSTLNPEIISSTYIGGSFHDSAYDIATDSEGNIYIAGVTTSPFLATAGAFRPWYSGATGPGGGDGFVAKFDPSGTRLLFFTYLGGSGNDAASAIAIDPDGNILVAGVTDSTDFPVFRALKPVISGQPDPYDQNLYPYDIFLAKISPSGSALLYATYLGGSGRDQAADLAIGTNGSAYIIGFTESGDFPRNRWSQSLRGKSDAFIMKVASNGRAIQYSRLLGGGSNERGQSITVDSLGRAFATGYTKSSNFPVSTNAFQGGSAGGRDAFLAIINPDGTTFHSTLFGGGGDDVGYRIALGADGNPAIVGTVLGSGFPVTPSQVNPGGLFRTTDDALTWSPFNNGLLHTEIQSLAFQPLNPATLYAGTKRGLFRSTDNAASWHPLLLATADTHAVAPDLFNPEVLYLGIASGLRKSTNSGVTWEKKNRGLPAAKVYDLLPDPQIPGSLFAATGAGLYQTTNSAEKWRFAGRGMGSPAVFTLALSPFDNNLLYAGTSAGVYRSTNRGASWFSARKGIGSVSVRALGLCPACPNTAYAGTSSALYKSLDAGTNWFKLPFTRVVTNYPVTTNTFLTTNLNNSIVTNTILVTNTVISTNLLVRNPNVRAIALDPTNPSILYAGTTTGLFRSLDAGLQWQSLTNNLTVPYITLLQFHPFDPSILYAGTSGKASSGGTDAFLTRFDSNLSVASSAVFGGTASDTPWDLAFDPQGNTFVVGTTISRNFPTNNLDLSTNAPPTLSARNRGGNDAFVTAFTPDLTRFLFSGYLGGRGNDRAAALIADPSGTLAISGATSSKNFPAILPFKARISGATDAFLLRLLLSPPD